MNQEKDLFTVSQALNDGVTNEETNETVESYHPEFYYG